ncbi:hypothetical protein BGW39_009037, partial [Mortierella sp. 14UC]
ITTHNITSKGAPTADYTKDLDVIEDQIASLYPQITNDIQLQDCLPEFQIHPRGSSLRSIWEEWFSATVLSTTIQAHDVADTDHNSNSIQHKASIWSLNRFHRHWRSMCCLEDVNAYWMKRVVVQEVVKEVAMMASEVGRGRQRRPASLEDRVERALEIVQREIDEAGSVSCYYALRHMHRGGGTR